MDKVIRRLAATAKKRFLTVHNTGVEFDVSDGFGVTWFAVPQTTAGPPPSVGILKRGVQIKSDIANTDIVYVGGSNVAANKVASTNGGYPLSPGDTIFIPIDKIEKIYFVSPSASQNVCLLYS